MNRISHTAAAAAALVTTPLAVVALAAPAPAAAAAEPPPVKISEVAYNGTGCKPDSRPLAHLEDDGQWLTVEFPILRAQGGEVPQGDGTSSWVPRATSNCQVNLKLSYPEGWSFAVTAAGGIGYVDLAEGATAAHIGSYYFAGSPGTTTGQRTFTGPVTDTYRYLDRVATPQWSECGANRALNVNSRVRVDASKTDRESLSEVTLDASITAMRWRRC